MRAPDRERGAALLTVLLMVAIISVLAAAALEKLRLSTRLAGNAGATEQARAYAIAAETLATVRIDALLANQPDRITLAGGWSGRPFSLPVPGGLATARVRDGGNCFNLNGLVTQTGPGVYAAAPDQVRQFARLMRLIGVPAQNGESIAAAAADWIDSDSAPSPGGAEDASYGGGDPPYRTANTLMADPSELRAVLGMTPAIYAQLRPWVCTLPQARPGQINVDTLAPEQAPLVAALAPERVSVDQVRAALLGRPPQGYASAGDFWKAPALATSGFDGSAQSAVKTGWFALDVDVAFGDARLEEHGLIDATRLPSRLVSRQWGEAS